MNDHSHFLESIRNADGLDDAPSRIFADWLEERGDLARAELIRVQMELASMGDRGPCLEDRVDKNWDAMTPALDDVAWESVTEPERFAVLKRREQALLAEYGEEWRTPPQSWRLSWGPFERGFVRTARVLWSDPSDFHVLQLLRGTAISFLQIERFERGPWTLEASRALTKALRRYDIGPIRQLRILGTTLEPGAIKALADSSRLAGLRGLSIVTWGRQDLSAEVKALTSRPCWADSLRALRLPANDKTLEALILNPKLPELREASLTGSARVDLLLSAMSAWPDVEDWRLGLEATNSAAIALGQSLRLPNVTSLRFIMYSNVGPSGAEALASCPGLAALRGLKLSANPIGDSGLQALARSPYLSQLRTLDIHRAQIGGDGASALFDSPIGAALTSLKMGDNPVLGDDDGSPQVWRSWADSPNLHGLDVSRGYGGSLPISKPTLASIAESPAAAGLLFLSLKRQPVQDDGAAILARAFADRGLLGLDLDEAEMTPMARRTLVSRLSGRRLIELRVRSMSASSEFGSG